MKPTIGLLYKLRKGVVGRSSGPEEYQNECAVLTATLDGIAGGLFFREGLCGIRYWNIQDVEEVKP